MLLWGSRIYESKHTIITVWVECESEALTIVVNLMVVTVVNEVATNLMNFVVIVVVLEPLVVAAYVQSDDLSVSRRLANHCDEKLSRLSTTTTAARAPDFLQNGFGSH